MAAGALEVGVVSIRVRPDMHGFKQAVEAYMSRLRDVGVNVRPKNLDKFQKDLEASLEGKTFKANVDVDATKSLKSLAKDIKAATSSIAVDIPVRFQRPSIQTITGRWKQSRVGAVTGDLAWATGVEAAGKRFRDYIVEAHRYAKRIPREVVGVSGGLKSSGTPTSGLFTGKQPVKVAVELDDASVHRLRRTLQDIYREFERSKAFGKDIFGAGPATGRALRELKNSIRGLDLSEASIRRVSKSLDGLSSVSDGVFVNLQRARREINKVVDIGPQHVGFAAAKDRVRSFEVGANKTLLGSTLRQVENLRRAAVRYKVSNRVLKNVHAPKFKLPELSEAAKSAVSVTQLLRELRESADDTGEAMVRAGRRAKGAFGGFGWKRRKGLMSVDELGTKKFAGLSRVGWIVAGVSSLIAPAVQAVSGLLATLPSLGFAAAAALGATVLGWDGIKDAAKTAAPAVDRAKEALSGVFRERLGSQFAQLGEGLDAIRPSLARVAHGMSDFSQGFIDAVTQTRGVSKLNSVLDRTAGLFSDMRPFAHDFTTGLLDVGEVGSRTFPKLAEGMNRFGASFKQAVFELSESGQLQTAIESTYEVLGSMGTNIGRIIRSGIETFTPGVSRAFDKLFDGFADGVVKLMPTLSSFSTNVATILGEGFSQVGVIAEAIGPSLQNIFNNLGPGLTSVIEGLGGAAKVAAEPLGRYVEELSKLAGLGLEGVGEALKGIADGISEGVEDLKTGESSLAKLRNELHNFSEETKNSQSISDQWRDGWKRFSEDMVESVDLWSRALDPFRRLDNFVDQRALQQAGVSLNDFMGEVERLQRLSLNFANVELVIETSIRTSNGSGGLAQDIEEQIHRLKSLEKVLKVDLEAEINLVSKAGSQEELQDISNKIADQFKTGTLGKPVEVGVVVDPKLEIPEGSVDTSGVDAALESSVENIGIGMGAAVDSALSGKAEEIGGIAQQQADETARLVGEAFGSMEIPTEGLTASLGAALDRLREQVVAKTEEIGTEVENSFRAIPSAITPVFSELGGGIAGEMATVQSSITDAGEAARASFTGAMSGMKDTSVGIAAETASAIRAALTMDLTASGVAVGSTFAAGIRSQVGAVSSAAAELAAAARSKFPNSPAKEGPFSGAGWVDRSGEAIGRDFARGIQSGIHKVHGATKALVAAAKRPFTSSLFGGMEEYHRGKILRPVLERNAKKIADWRKREADNAERVEARIRKVTESKKSQAEQEAEIANIRAKAVGKDEESYQKMLDSLEVPDYSQINRSVQAYWIDGAKDAATDWMKDLRLGAGIRDSVNGLLQQFRAVFGDNPVVAQVEANVNAEHFEWSMNKVIEESRIAEVPINFAVANLDQLKTDLGMGNGVVSRAIDQVLRFDPNNSDANLFARQAAKTEVHYHVADMQEAIRLEDLRRRKEALRSK